MKAVFGARLLGLALLLSTGAQAEVRLPKVFGSHMVLQRDKPLTIWGWADPNEQVTVKLADQPAATATAGADGAWRVVLPPQAAGGPCTLTVRGTNEIVLDDVLIGEVWVCSGQSNMEWRVASSLNFEQEKAAAQHPRIRQLAVAKKPAPQAQPDVLGDWTVCSPDTVGSFTAAGYFMARDLIKQLDVPIGLINTSWGGTRIEPWTPPVGFEGIETLAAIRRQVTLADPKSAEHKELLAKQVQLTESWVAQAREALAKELLLPARRPTPPNCCR